MRLEVAYPNGAKNQDRASIRYWSIVSVERLRFHEIVNQISTL